MGLRRFLGELASRMYPVDVWQVDLVTKPHPAGRGVIITGVSLTKGPRREYIEARAIGIAESNEKWRAWLTRQADAKANGQPFTQPPPT